MSEIPGYIPEQETGGISPITATDYYEILNISRNANADQIRSAHRELSRKYHQDVNPNDTVAYENFLKVQKAFEVLSDSNARYQYDRFGPFGASSVAETKSVVRFGNFEARIVPAEYDPRQKEFLVAGLRYNAIEVIEPGLIVAYLGPFSAVFLLDVNTGEQVQGPYLTIEKDSEGYFGRKGFGLNDKERIRRSKGSKRLHTLNYETPFAISH